MAQRSGKVLSERVSDSCRLVVVEAVRRRPDLLAVLIASSDGFEIASEALEPEIMSRLAAMSSSMVALSDAIVRELALGSGANLVIEADAGRLLMQGVRHAEGNLILTVVSALQTPVVELMQAADESATELMIEVAGT